MSTSNKILQLGRMARHIGVSQKWLRDEVSAGRLPAIQAGQKLLFNPEAIESLLAERASGRTSQTSVAMSDITAIALTLVDDSLTGAA